MNKKVKMELIGIDGNAFVILGLFARKAKQQGWSKEEINLVMDEARSGDYHHALRTIMKHVTRP